MHTSAKFKGRAVWRRCQFFFHHMGNWEMLAVFLTSMMAKFIVFKFEINLWLLLTLPSGSFFFNKSHNYNRWDSSCRYIDSISMVTYGLIFNYPETNFTAAWLVAQITF